MLHVPYDYASRMMEAIQCNNPKTVYHDKNGKTSVIDTKEFMFLTRNSKLVNAVKYDRDTERVYPVGKHILRTTKDVVSFGSYVEGTHSAEFHSEVIPWEHDRLECVPAFYHNALLLQSVDPLNIESILVYETDNGKFCKVYLSKHIEKPIKYIDIDVTPRGANITMMDHDGKFYSARSSMQRGSSRIVRFGESKATNDNIRKTVEGLTTNFYA